ncbi:MAG TPA: hypothetical protein VI968_01810 [archaeon]|nr:hypothetical protein [archaeon]
MAKKKARARKRSTYRRNRYNKSLLTKEELYLNKHDEEKLILFAAGMLFGIGLSTAILGALVYSGLVAIVLALVLLMLEARQESK